MNKTSTNKTQATRASVLHFLDAIEDEQKRKDAKLIDKIFRKISGHNPVMWGSSIVGYGAYHYRYKSGREGDYMRIGFSPRKQSLTLYIMPGFDDYTSLLENLGKHKTGKSCLYIKKLADVDINWLTKIARRAWRDMNSQYPESEQER